MVRFVGINIRALVTLKATNVVKYVLHLTKVFKNGMILTMINVL